VIENLRGQPQQKAEDVIRKARRKRRHTNVIQIGDAAGCGRKNAVSRRIREAL
jgi:hypothetical protein